MRPGPGNTCVFDPGTNDRKECATAECAGGVLPNPPQDPCFNCRAGCFGEFLNPIPGIGIEKGAGAAGNKIGSTVGELARDAAKKINKIDGAYSLGECLDGCKAICNPEQCEK